MTLLGAILHKVMSKDSMNRKYSSPPPELETARVLIKVKRPINKYSKVKSRVDTSPPLLDMKQREQNLRVWKTTITRQFLDNVKLLTGIKRYHLLRGKVDCRWEKDPERTKCYYYKRKTCLAQIQAENKEIYTRIISAQPRVIPTKCLLEDWSRNREIILELATMPFILFPPVPTEIMEDVAFKPPPGVKRIRLRLEVGIKESASLGEVVVELFTETCPLTSQLFQELAAGDGVGYSYIGTKFYTKVPGLYWSGGDVIFNNGFGCYAQVGRRFPIGAENYHYSHSMPGLLSMRMTNDNEMCGSFNITFKPMPQFDLKNVVFGRVVRPCNTFEAIRCLGSALSSRPVVEIINTRRKVHGEWVYGTQNTKLEEKYKIYKRFL